jgi:hypothetical protein
MLEFARWLAHVAESEVGELERRSAGDVEIDKRPVVPAKRSWGRSKLDGEDGLRDCV